MKKHTTFVHTQSYGCGEGNNKQLSILRQPILVATKESLYSL